MACQGCWLQSTLHFCCLPLRQEELSCDGCNWLLVGALRGHHSGKQLTIAAEAGAACVITVCCGIGVTQCGRLNLTLWSMWWVQGQHLHSSDDS